MKKSIRFAVLLCCVILAIIFTLFKISDKHVIYEASQGVNSNKEDSEDTSMEYINSINRFAYKSSEYILSKNDGKSNYLYSPLSAHMALSVLSEITQGETREQLCESIGYIHLDNSKSKARSLIDKLCFNNRNKSLVHVGNSLWLGKRIKYNDALLKDLSERYGLSSYNVSFGTKSSSRQIARWVNENTGGFMKQGSDAFPSNEDTVLQIINTLHVKDRWEDPFKPDATYSGIFNISEEESVECSYMSKIAYNFSIYEDEKYIRFKLPMENMGEMVFVTPKGNIELADIAGNIESIMTSKENLNTVASLSIPKFKFNRREDLRNMLMSFGIEKIFTQQEADFTPVTEEENLFVNKIEQVSGIEVNEYGCEAASYTKIEGATSLLIKTEIKLNKPFIFSIVRENVILYMGIINDPAFK